MATEIILTLGQAFEIAYQIALQEQHQTAKETPEGTSGNQAPEGAAEASIADGGSSKIDTDVKTNINSEIDNIAQRVTNTHIHKTTEKTEHLAKDSTVTQAEWKDDSVTKKRTDPVEEQTACHNITRTESSV